MTDSEAREKIYVLERKVNILNRFLSEYMNIQQSLLRHLELRSVPPAEEGWTVRAITKAE